MRLGQWIQFQIGLSHRNRALPSSYRTQLQDLHGDEGAKATAAFKDKVPPQNICIFRVLSLRLNKCLAFVTKCIYLYTFKE